jgi:tripartite-type tricarboxylate transporter receptor subunit TctC
MRRKQILACLWVAATCFTCFTCLRAASAEMVYPTRPIRLIVPFPPGGSSDVVVRSIQPLIERQLGQSLVIDNRSGAGGVIGVDVIAKAPPDGYTIGIGNTGALAVDVNFNKKMPYDPQKDLAPITRLVALPFILAASNSSAINSLREVIARAKSEPASLSIGHGGNGTAMHLSAELFNQMAGTHITLVPYRGTGPVTADLLAGHIPLGVIDIPSSLALIKAGQIKALAISSIKRYPLMPDIPTLDEAGVPGFESIGWFGVLAPAGTPAEVIVKLNRSFVTALENPELRDRIVAVGADPTPSTPNEFAAFITSETTKWKQVISVSGASNN